MHPTHIIPSNEKTAMGTSMTKLGPRPDRWIMEVVQRLHEEHPYLAQYALQGKLVSSNAERLYGAGYIEVRTPTESKVGTPSSRIPFIVENGMLHPMKVFLDTQGRADLLDKDIFSEAMFSHPLSLSLSERGEDPSLVGQLYPPDRTRYGMTGGLGESTQMKMGSFSPSALIAAGGALGAAQTGGGDAGLAPTIAGGAGGAAGLYGGHRLGKWVGGTLGQALSPGTGQRVGEAIGGVLGGATGGHLGSSLAARETAQFMQNRQAGAAMSPYKYGGVLPYLGDDAETMLKMNGVKLSVQERKGLHKKAMAKMNYSPRNECILDKIAHTIRPEDQKKVAHTILKENLSSHFIHNGYQGLVQMALSASPVEKRAGIQHYDVVQVERLGQGRVRIKTAQTDAYDPMTDVVSVQDASSLVGDDLVGTLDVDGRITVTTAPAIQETLDDLRVENIKDYGIYKVQTLESETHMIGWVITNVIDFDMNSSTLILFNNGQNYALQDSIAGVRVAMGTSLPRKKPSPGDTGVFYYAGPSGRVTCTLPVNIMHTEEFDGQHWLAAVDLWGKPLRLTYAPQLKKIVEVTPLGETQKCYAIPDYMFFMPLHEEVRLVPEAVLFSKLASAKTYDRTVEIIHNGTSFSLRGEPVEKLAATEKHFLPEAGVEFALVAMGVPLELAREKMARAMVYGESKIAGVRPVSTKEERQQKIASISAAIQDSLKDVIPYLKRNTVKIAAELPDIASPEAVDSVLSLNFINPDNLSLFIESLPHLTIARKDLAELYLAALLGMPDLPRQSIIRGMEALRDVCQGLRKVKMRAMLV